MLNTETVLKIGGTVLKIRISPQLPNTAKFISDYFQKNSSKVIDGEIIVDLADKCNLVVDKNKSEMRLTLDGDRIENSFYFVGLLQAFYRFAGLLSMPKGIFLIHGSAALFNNKALVFADNGTSLAKSICSFIIAERSKKYISDEFTFFDAEKNLVLCRENPLMHFRPWTINELSKIYPQLSEIKNPPEQGIFLRPQELDLEWIQSAKLGSFAYIYFDHKNPLNIRKYNPEETLSALKVTFGSHIAKLLNPSLDRMSLFSKTDGEEVTDTRVVCKKIMKPYNDTLAALAKDVSAFEVWTPTSVGLACQAEKLMPDTDLLHDNEIVQDLKENFEKTFVSKLKNHLGDSLQNVIVAGSFARGNWIAGWSDIDTAVIVNNISFETLQDLNTALKSLEKKYGVRIGLTTFTQKELELPIGNIPDKIRNILYFLGGNSKVIYGEPLQINKGALEKALKQSANENMLNFQQLLIKYLASNLKSGSYRKCLEKLIKFSTLVARLALFQHGYFTETVNEVGNTIKKAYPNADPNLYKEFQELKLRWPSVTEEESKGLVGPLLEREIENYYLFLD